MEANWGRIAPVFSAIILSLAFPPLRWSVLLFVGLAPFLASLKNTTLKQALGRGYLFGLVFSLQQLHWVEELVARWTHSVALGVFPWLLASATMALYFALFALLCRQCWIRGWILCIPLLWAGMEAFRSFVPGLAFPWALLASPLATTPVLIQTAHFGAIYLVSAWVVAANVLVVGWLPNRAQPTPAEEAHRLIKRQTPWLACAFVALLLLSIGWFYRPQGGTPLKVTIGQTGVDMAFSTPAEADARTVKAVNALVAHGLSERSQLLVLPEGISRTSGPHPDYLPFHLDANLPTLFGGQRGTGPVYQSAFAFDGKRWQVFDKTRLVVFGEYVPGRNFLPFLSLFNLPDGDLSPGTDGVHAVSLAGYEVGPVLCFEALFPDVAYRQALNGSSLLAVMSIDDWFMDSSAPETLRDASVWRSVETGLPVARSATTGYTMAVDSRGVVFRQAPMGKQFALETTFKIKAGHQEWPLMPLFPACCIGMLVLVPIYGALANRKSKSSKLPSTAG